MSEPIHPEVLQNSLDAATARLEREAETSDMTQRVARAMCEKAGTAWANTSGDEYAPALISRPFWLQQARTAIDAMHRPTDAMLNVGADWGRRRFCSREVWKAMIDEALK